MKIFIEAVVIALTTRVTIVMSSQRTFYYKFVKTADDATVISNRSR